jgi:hypothetical protein
MTYPITFTEEMQPSVDQAVNTTLTELELLRNINQGCYNSLVALACGAAYPLCSPEGE